MYIETFCDYVIIALLVCPWVIYMALLLPWLPIVLPACTSIFSIIIWVIFHNAHSRKLMITNS